MTCTMCEALKTLFLKLAKPKPLRRLNSKLVLPITHTIYITLIVQNHTEQLTSILMIKLGQHSIILGKP